MSSIDTAEIARFSSHAADWWNPDGALKPLHKLNPTRLAYIRDRASGHWGRQGLRGLSVLDIGCGGGLLCEPLARMGAAVTGLDASRDGIAAAQTHAAQSGLDIAYLCAGAEDFAQRGQKFDVIAALEILEHVADIGSFMAAVAAMLKPGGLLILSTVNRTVKSYLLGIVAAEYLLKWVPQGTHDWRRFLKPSELAAHLDQAGLCPRDVTGVVYDPLTDAFRLQAGAAGVNYMMTATFADL